MSRLEELIQELCPDGVEYFPLDYIAEIGTGSSNTQDELEVGLYPFYVRSPMVRWSNNYEYDEKAIIIPGDGVGVGKIYHYIEGKYALHQRAYRIHVKDENIIIPKYLYRYMEAMFGAYILKTSYHGSVASVRRPMLAQFEIPVPPMELQREIVRILDQFTTLRAELSSELTARRKQYEYYRDKLLPFNHENVEWKTLGDISLIVRGASPRPIRNYITNNEAGVNWIKIGDVRQGEKYITSCVEKITEEGAKKSRFVKPGDFILSNSMSFGRPYILKIEGCIHDGWLAISDFEKYVTPDYLYHVLVSKYIQTVMSQKASFGGAVQNLNADIVRGIEIPIVSKEKQKQIVSVLDNLSVFCNDISLGLPAEIEARTKQYEYYRDKLLTFKRKEA